MNPRLLPLDPANHAGHPMHADERIWSETNCYIDLWVEVLHALGHDPVPATAATLSADFDGHQWSFLKFEPADLRTLYGIEVAEMNLWRTVAEHVVQELAAGRLLTVEVDSFWLPDTLGTSYQTEHVKTTIVLNRLDIAGRTAEYFHNSGYYRLDAQDFRGVFHLDGAPPQVLPPYVEMVRLDRMHRCSRRRPSNSRGRTWPGGPPPTRSRRWRTACSGTWSGCAAAAWRCSTAGRSGCCGNAG